MSHGATIIWLITTFVALFVANNTALLARERFKRDAGSQNVANTTIASGVNIELSQDIDDAKAADSISVPDDSANRNSKGESENENIANEQKGDRDNLTASIKPIYMRGGFFFLVGVTAGYWLIVSIVTSVLCFMFICQSESDEESVEKKPEKGGETTDE
ncbi:hypothetical protein Tcan_16853 [Toxocara canis]|uniref:Transmembrane protein n=1 Tax=Toxocara canis TaxID=6265 RepID=A0A0B2UI72_TOXCA|nr:hypothetical protein Tcan_16853 [Toxocara canis]